MTVLAGFGQHVYYLSLSSTKAAIKYAIFSEATFSLSLAFSKLSICLFLLSIIRNSTKFGQVVAAWVDLSLATFPISFLKDLQLSTKSKAALCTLMSFGVFAGVCAVVRTTLESSLSSRADLTWDLVDAAIWAIVETNVSIIVACIPTFKPLYVFLISNLGSRKQSHAFIADDDEEARRHGGRIQGSHYLEAPYAMTTYPSATEGGPGMKKKSGSERKLRSDVGMPGVS
ncbi:MAG: hypothetical protein Q9161_007188 [Pseudevernia consocians]